MLFIGLLVPYNDPNLPKMVDLQETLHSLLLWKIPVLKSYHTFFNAVIVTTIISAGNSNVYSGSRILYGLAQAGVAPKFFLKTNKGGVPYFAVLFTAAFGALGYLACSEDGNKAFTWLLNIIATAGLIAWGFISVSHVRFMNVLRKEV